MALLRELEERLLCKALRRFLRFCGVVHGILCTRKAVPNIRTAFIYVVFFSLCDSPEPVDVSPSEYLRSIPIISSSVYGKFSVDDACIINRLLTIRLQFSEQSRNLSVGKVFVSRYALNNFSLSFLVQSLCV